MSCRSRGGDATKRGGEALQVCAGLLMAEGNTRAPSTPTGGLRCAAISSALFGKLGV